MNDNEKTFKEILKRYKPTLFKIDEFIEGMGNMGWGQVDVKIKVRNYSNFCVEMVASDNKKDKKSYYGKKFDAVIDKKK